MFSYKFFRCPIAATSRIPPDTPGYPRIPLRKADGYLCLTPTGHPPIPTNRPTNGESFLGGLLKGAARAHTHPDRSSNKWSGGGRAQRLLELHERQVRQVGSVSRRFELNQSACCGSLSSTLQATTAEHHPGAHTPDRSTDKWRVLFGWGILKGAARADTHPDRSSNTSPATSRTLRTASAAGRVCVTSLRT